MLELANVSLETNGNLLLGNISATFPKGHFGAIIGPSGCGKTTLLKLIAGIAPGDEEGTVHWKSRDLSKEDFAPSEIAYVPQFGIAHGELTARECLHFALRLRVRRAGQPDPKATVESLLGEAGMQDFAGQRVETLSGGQRRRLALAMELTCHPEILLCDEVTSGLDPHSENEIVRLLHSLSRRSGRLVLSVTHSLEHLGLYDSVTVLYKGALAYQGPPDFLAHYFGVESPAQLYSRLALREPGEWAASWTKHRNALADAAKSTSPPDAPAPEAGTAPPPAPGPASQFLTLFQRRLLVFSRSGPQLLLQAGLVLGFPLLVAAFAFDGIPAVKNLSMGLDLDVLTRLNEAREFLIQSSKVGSLVSGIVMFQVILLTLMGANNSGREIAAERGIFEQEKLSGLSPLAYVASKAAFLSILVAVQSIWMGVFVHHVCGFPGSLGAQLAMLLLVNSAMTSICLAVSSLLSSPEQASLASIYIVGFQLPLSGAVLALPEMLGAAVRPFISAYWSWSGILQTLRGERYYDIVQTVAQSPLAPAALCTAVLLLHTAAGLAIAWIGCERRQHA
jgi:ABC-type multidrug transport system ATPase subunit